MSYLTLVLNGVATIATIISTVIAVKAKNEAKRIYNSINSKGNIELSGNHEIHIESNGNNSGVISGINSGVINK